MGDENLMSKVVTIDEINQNLIQMQYAVRGLVPTVAAKIAKELETAAGKGKYPFEEILYCNIGNPQSVGQKPFSYYRNVMALCDLPHLIQDEGKMEALNALFPADCIATAKDMLEKLKVGTGAYSHSQGHEFIRQNVCKFIENRDGYPADPDHIFLTNGASVAAILLFVLLITSAETGVLIPIPQYPLYSAIIKLLGGTQLSYYLKEEEGWTIDAAELKRVVDKARKDGIKPKVMVVINPGNPTGAVLDYDALRDIVVFCKEEGILLISDEVYQENVYVEDKSFVSMKKVAMDLAAKDEMYNDLELVSFHSTSKGVIGECGRRGGYMEICGMDSAVFDQLAKLSSVILCSNIAGQVMMNLMVTGPNPNGESYDQFEVERSEIFNGLKSKSILVYEALNKLNGVSCQVLEGAMYAFPKITLPKKAILAAQAEKQAPDTFYVLSLLYETGICCVPGSGFGQKDGTFHLRMTILPEEEKLRKAMDAFEVHHLGFLAKYRDGDVDEVSL